MLVVYPLFMRTLFPTEVSNLFYIGDSYFLYSVLFTLLIVLLYQKPQNTFLHITCILSFLLELYLAILFSVITLRILRFQTPSPCGIDIFISKLAIFDL